MSPEPLSITTSKSSFALYCPSGPPLSYKLPVSPSNVVPLTTEIFSGSHAQSVSSVVPPHTPRQSSTAAFTPPHVPSQLKSSLAGNVQLPNSP